MSKIVERTLKIIYSKNDFNFFSVGLWVRYTLRSYPGRRRSLLLCCPGNNNNNTTTTKINITTTTTTIVIIIITTIHNIAVKILLYYYPLFVMFYIRDEQLKYLSRPKKISPYPRAKLDMFLPIQRVLFFSSKQTERMNFGLRSLCCACLLFIVI